MAAMLDPRAAAQQLAKSIRAHVWRETLPTRDRIDALEAEVARLRQAARLEADALERLAGRSP